ncbi:MAG: hypothetical protein NVS2B7_27030 [Herpetosiphon sp.]
MKIVAFLALLLLTGCGESVSSTTQPPIGSTVMQASQVATGVAGGKYLVEAPVLVATVAAGTSVGAVVGPTSGKPVEKALPKLTTLPAVQQLTEAPTMAAVTATVVPSGTATGVSTATSAVPTNTIGVGAARPDGAISLRTVIPSDQLATAFAESGEATHFLAHTWQNGAAGSAAEAGALCSSTQEIARYNHQTMLAPYSPVIVPVRPGCVASAAGERLLVERGNPVRPRVALTFDAGAGAGSTAAMLAALRQRGTHVTFFLTGRWMNENPALVRQIVADGHELANHSVTHPDFTKLSDDGILAELRDTERIARTLGNVSSRPFFRPPFGAYNRHVLDVAIGAGYLPIYWTLDSLDSIGQPKSPAFLLERVTRGLPREQLNGAIILMHCGSVPSGVALPLILDRFAQMGVEVVPVSQALAR